MSPIAAVGISQRKNSYQAGRAAIEQAFTRLSTHCSDLILLFTSEHYDQAAVLRGVRSLSGDTPLIGCCGGGILTAKGLRMKAVALMAIRSDEITVDIASGQIQQESARQTGEQVAELLGDRLMDAPSGCHSAAIVLLENYNGTQLDIVAGMTDTLGPICPLVGGGASVNVSRQFFNDQLCSQAIVAALLRSTSSIGIGVRHGWKPVGNPLVVTQSEGNYIVRLNGRPAFEVFQEIFSSVAPDLRAEMFYQFTRTHPIGLPQMSGEYLVREVFQARPDGAIHCAAHIPENAVMRFMEGDPDSLVNGAQQAAYEARAALDGKPAGAVIVFDCVSRLPILGDKASAEIEAIRNVFGDGIPLLGLYSYGEIGKPAGVNLAAYQNKTIVVCALPSH